MIKKTHCLLFVVIFLSALTGCGAFEDRRHRIVVDVRHQEMIVYEEETPIRTYPVSTSKFGINDSPGSYGTPAGTLKIKQKIGEGLPQGAVFKSRRATGEVLAVNAPGRDPIVTRILWLKGLEDRNANAYNRFIYIHGTPEEKNIGRPASYGCIRMRSRDVADLYEIVGVGAVVEIKAEGAPRPTVKLASTGG